MTWIVVRIYSNHLSINDDFLLTTELKSNDYDNLKSKHWISKLYLKHENNLTFNFHWTWKRDWADLLRRLICRSCGLWMLFPLLLGQIRLELHVNVDWLRYIIIGTTLTLYLYINEQCQIYKLGFSNICPNDSI